MTNMLPTNYWESAAPWEATKVV